MNQLAVAIIGTMLKAACIHNATHRTNITPNIIRELTRLSNKKPAPPRMTAKNISFLVPKRSISKPSTGPRMPVSNLEKEKTTDKDDLVALNSVRIGRKKAPKP
jgi:hypothetical protein